MLWENNRKSKNVKSLLASYNFIKAWSLKSSKKGGGYSDTLRTAIENNYVYNKDKKLVPNTTDKPTKKKWWIGLTFKEYMTKINSGKSNPMYNHKYEESTIELMSDKKLGNKNPSFGKHWYTNGKKNIMCFDNEIPKGFKRGRNL